MFNKLIVKLTMSSVLAASFVLLGCGDSNEKGGGSSTGGSGKGGTAGAVYGIGTLVTADSVSSGYLLLANKLDFAGLELTLKDAREFAGQSDFATHRGAVLVASGDKPTIEKFE